MPASLRCFVAVVGISSSISGSPEASLPEAAGGIPVQLGVQALVEKQSTVRAIACEASVPPDFALAVLDQESGFDNSMRGSQGEIGVSQILPATALALGFDVQRLRREFSYNARAGVTILRRLLTRSKGDRTNALREYRAGPAWARLAPRLQRYVHDYVASVEQLSRTRYAGVGCD